MALNLLLSSQEQRGLGPGSGAVVLVQAPHRWAVSTPTRRAVSGQRVPVLEDIPLLSKV